jgi:magnesium chelatase family protein
MNKLSGPLLDRIDIHIEVQKVEFEQLSEKGKAKKAKTSENGF